MIAGLWNWMHSIHSNQNILMCVKTFRTKLHQEDNDVIVDMTNSCIPCITQNRGTSLCFCPILQLEIRAMSCNI